MTQMQWDPIQFFRSDIRPSNPFAILILNQPINDNALAVLRKHACFIICADGGANRFYDLMKKNSGKESINLPNAIAGDLDSIKPHVKQHYQSCGVPIIHDPDQESADFTKCMKYLRSNTADIITSSATSTASTQPSPSLAETDHLDILVFGGLGGRVDQAFAQLHQLYAASQQAINEASKGELYLISEESISFVLRRGGNTIRTAKGASYEPHGENGHRRYLEESVGILPVGGPSVISTEGLEWDVRDWKTEIGGKLSTSNHIRAGVVSVETTEPVFFTAELAERFKVGGGKG